MEDDESNEEKILASGFMFTCESIKIRYDVRVCSNHECKINEINVRFVFPGIYQVLIVIVVALG